MKTSLNKKALSLIATIACCIIAGQAFGHRNMSSDSFPYEMDSVSTEINVIRTIPKGFKLLDNNSRIFKTTPYWIRNSEEAKWEKGSAYNGFAYYPVQSDDGQCELLYNFLIYDPYGKPGQPGKPVHRSHIWIELLGMLDGRDDFRLEDYVTIISGKEAKKRFNADSIFIYDIPFEPLELDGKVYKYFTRMYMSKNGRPAMSFAWLFTEEGLKKKDYYIRKLDKNVWYKE